MLADMSVDIARIGRYSTNNDPNLKRRIFCISDMASRVSEESVRYISIPPFIFRSKKVQVVASWKSKFSDRSNTQFPHIFLSTVHLAKYDLGDIIGCGSFGQVVAATRKADNSPVRTGN